MEVKSTAQVHPGTFQCRFADHDPVDLAGCWHSSPLELNKKLRPHERLKEGGDQLLIDVVILDGLPAE